MGRSCPEVCASAASTAPSQCLRIQSNSTLSSVRFMPFTAATRDSRIVWVSRLLHHGPRSSSSSLICTSDGSASSSDFSGARGYMQERLADRAALALWRLDQVARYEAVSRMAQRTVAEEVGADPMLSEAQRLDGYARHVEHRALPFMLDGKASTAQASERQPSCSLCSLGSAGGTQAPGGPAGDNGRGDMVRGGEAREGGPPVSGEGAGDDAYCAGV